MSNIPTLPDADVREPIPLPEFDDDLIGIPLEEDMPARETPNPVVEPVPEDA
jgi:hypothetical protein